jgi:hypothetical protein
MQKRPVIIGAYSLESPDIGGKYLGKEPEIPDPGVLHHLRDVVIDESIAKGVKVYRAGQEDRDHDQEQLGFLGRKPRQHASGL